MCVEGQLKIQFLEWNLLGSSLSKGTRNKRDFERIPRGEEKKINVRYVNTHSFHLSPVYPEPGVWSFWHSPQCVSSFCKWAHLFLKFWDDSQIHSLLETQWRTRCLSHYSAPIHPIILIFNSFGRGREGNRSLQIFYRYAHLVTILMLSLTLSAEETACFSLAP